MNQYFGEYKKAKLMSGGFSMDTKFEEVETKQEPADSVDFSEYDEIYYLDEELQINEQNSEQQYEKNEPVAIQIPQRRKLNIQQTGVYEDIEYNELEEGEKHILIEIPSTTSQPSMAQNGVVDHVVKLNEILTILQELSQKIDSLEGNFDERLKMIDENVATLRQEIKEMVALKDEHVEVGKVETECELRQRLPCITENDVYALEEELETNAEIVDKLQMYIVQIETNHDDLEEFTKNALTLIFTNEVATKFSWSFNPNNRLPIRKFKIIAIVQGN